MSCLLACPHDDCVERKDMYKDLQHHFRSQHKNQSLDLDAAKCHTFEVQGKLMEEKILIASEKMETGENFTIRYDMTLLQVKDVDHYHAAIKAAHVLLVKGKLSKYSMSHETITVSGSTLTQVYKTWKSSNAAGFEIPEVECIKTFVNENWFNDVKNATDLPPTCQTNANLVDNCSSLLEHISITDSESMLPQIPETVNSAEDLLPVMLGIWGFTSFKGQQANAMNSILHGKDCFINIPTGGGKSLLYQLPAVSQPGITIVIEPIIALISDQIAHCQERNIPAAALYSGLLETYKQQVLHDLSLPLNPFKLLYTTPECLVGDSALHYVLNSLSSRGNIQRFVVDECHCVSLWGREFRPAYLKLGFLRKQCPSVPIVMLTATSTHDVQQDVCSVLSVTEPIVVKDNYNKPNIMYTIEYKDGKLDERIATEIKDCNCSIVYGSTRSECEAMCAKLGARNVNAKTYHGDMSKHLKKEIFERWMSGDVKCLICTKAFGMGVDKPDVRVIIHISLPSCMEDYYQETGRGGRDGCTCKCILYFSPVDANRHIHSIFRQNNHMLDVLNKRYRHFQEFFYFCFQTGLCRRRVLLDYFNSDSQQCGDLKCDQCQRNLETSVEDISELTCDIILCLLSMKKLNRRKFTLKQLSNVITGKCNRDVKKNGYDKAEKFGCYKASVSDGEYILHILVYKDVLRQIPPDTDSRNQSALYIDLGPQFIYVQNKQLLITYDKVQ